MGRTWRNRLRNKQSTRGTCLSLDRCTIELKRWMRSKGWMNETNLKLWDFTGTGRGVCAKLGAKEDDVLTEIPIELMVTFAVVKTSDCASFVDAPLTMHELLALFLVLEKHKGAKSEWEAYVNSLPEDLPGVPWLCSEDELKELPQDFAGEVEERRRRFNSSWGRVRGSIKTNTLCPCCGTSADRVITTDSFTWAYVMVNTRSVHVSHDFGPKEGILADDPTMALCPYLDMFNHSDEANTTAELTPDGGKYLLRTHTSYGRYQQIFISYGPHNNTKLLCEYGFYIPNNRYDCVPITFKETIEALHKLGLQFESKQYKYIIDKRLNEDLNISLNGPSFNLKAITFIALNPNLRDWSSTVYTTGYTEVDITKILELSKSVLTNSNDVSYKCNANNSVYMRNSIDYLNYTAQYRRAVVDYLSGEIAAHQV